MSGQGETAHLANGTNGTGASDSTSTSTSTNPNIAAMSTGRQFVFFQTVNGAVTKQDVFVFYEPEGKLGTLFWCEPGKREKDPARSLLLHQISDVFLGKQTPELKSKEAADHPSDRCFSIIAKGGSLHLRADSPEVRNAWLAGIKDVFTMSAQKKKQQQQQQSAQPATDKPADKAASNGNGTTSAAATTTAAATPAATPAPSSTSTSTPASSTAAAPAATGSSVDQMRAGSKFIGFFGTSPTTRRNIHVWLDSSVGRLGALYWSESDDKKPVDDQVLLLHKISDVFLGKQSAELKTSDGPASHCFSIVTSKPSSASVDASKPPAVLHLQAESEAVRTAWLAGIKEVFTAGSKNKDQKKEKPATATTTATTPAATAIAPVADKPAEKTTEKTAPAATTAAPAAAPAAASASSSHTGPVAVMSAGTSFTGFFSGEGGVVSKQPIFAFYDDGEGTGKLGSLYWNDTAGKKDKDASRQIPLHKITDVYLGKQTPELKSSSVGDIPSSSCFSIITKERSLHLQADAEPTRSTWLNGIKQLFSSSGKKVDDSKKKADAAAATETAKPAEKAAEPVKTDAKPAEPAKTETKLEPAAAAATAAPAVAAATATATAAAPATDSSVSPNVAAIIAGKSFIALFDKVNPSGAAKSPKKLDPAVASQAESREIVKRTVFVWYDPSHGKLGALHYNTDGEKKIQPVNNPLPLHKISDVFLGKQTIELRSSAASEYPSSSCFAIITSVQQLHLVADTEATKTQWLAAIKDVFTQSGKKVDDASKKEKSVESAAAATATTAANVAPATSTTTTPAPVKSAAAETATAAAPAAAAASASGVSSEEQDVAALSQGDVFTSYVGKENTAAKQIFLFLDRSQAKLGTLFYNEDVSSREQNPERALILHRISDVYMGKQTPELKSAAASAAPTNTCFAIHTKDRSLHLQAKSEAQRQQWLSAIRYIFSNAGKKVDDSAKTNATANANVTAASPKEAPKPAESSTTSAATTATPAAVPTAAVAAASNVEAMKAGRNLTAFFANKDNKDQVTSKSILLWYEDTDAGKLGSLYWNESGSKTRVDNQVIPLHKISDVYIGKQTPELKSEGAKEINHKHCFAILTKTSGLHLAAESEADRNLFLGGVKEIFSTGNKVVEDNKKAAASATASTSAAAAPATSATSLAAPSQDARRSSAVILQPLLAGTKLDALFGTTDPIKKSIFVFLEPSAKAGKLGSLYWTEDGKRTIIPDNSIPLDKITDVYAGKQSAALKSSIAESYNAKQCWSVVSKERALHLIAPTEQVRTDWLAALKLAFNKDEATQVQALPVTAATPIKLSDADHIEHISKGRQVTQYIQEGSNVVKKSVFLYYVQSEGKYGSLFMASDASKRGDMNGATSIPLQSITDVYSGKKTAELKSSEASAALPVNCFSIVSKKTALHIETESQAEATSWLDGIKAAFTSKGKNVKETQKTNATPAAPVSSGDSKSLLISGRPFIGYFGTPEAVTTKNISIFLEPTEGRLGTFYYHDSTVSRTKQVENSIPLHKISDVYLGKQTKILQSRTVTGAADTCFTVVTRKTVLNLQAPSASARTEFLNALHSIFTSSGKRVVEDEPRAKPSVDVNAKSVSPRTEGSYEVTSPYGIGMVDEAPRADGIVVVKLPWATGYMHQSSIDRVRSVETSMGPGKLTGPARHDGIIPVLLPFGVAYMSEDSVDKDTRKLVLKDGRIAYLLGPLHEGKYHVRLENGALTTITKDEIVEDQQALASPTAAAKLTRDDSTRILRQGATFTSFPSATATPQQIDLFLDENEGKLGTIYAADVGSRQKDANKALPLHRITDLFLGKQTGALLGSSASSIPDSRCFSIISKVHKVDVAADSEKTRNNWLYAIHGILTSSGRKVIEEKVSSSSTTPATSTTSTLVPPADKPRRYSVTKPELPTVEVATTTLSSGASFYTYVKSGSDYLRRPTFAYLDTTQGKLGAIVLSEDGSKHKTATPDKIFKLDEMRDIYLGKRTPALASSVAKNVSADHTFSVILKDKRSLDLEASNKETREKWFFGLYAILSNSQKKVIRKDSTQPASAVPTAVPTSTPSVVATGVGSVLTSGQKFLVHRGDTQHSVSEPGYLFYDESAGKLGSIVVSSTEHKSDKATLSLPLDRISDVFLGKQTAAFKSPQNKETPLTQCFSLVTSQHMLNLQASSDEARTAWLNDFKAVFAKRAAEVKARKTAEKAAAAQKTPEAIAASAAPVTDDPIITSMKNGRNFISYTADPVAKTRVLVWFVQEDGRFGTLYWSKSGTKEEKKESQSLPLHRITDMYLGKQTPVFQLSEHASAFGTRCFSIVSKKTQLHLEAETREERDSWLNKINHILQTSGKRVVDKEKSTYERPATLPTVPKDLMAKMTSRRPSILAIPPQGTVRMMEHGTVFTRHRVDSAPEKITLFYQSDARLGSLFWYTGSSRVAKTSQSLPLNQVTDVMLGKQSPAFLKAPASINEVLCFALLGQNSSLELEAESTEQLTAWLFGVNSLLTGSGRKIVLEEPAAGTAEPSTAPRESTLSVQQNAPRRYSVMKSELPALAGAEGEGESETKSSLESTNITLPSDITTRIITKGTNFTLYSSTHDKHEIFLFYEAAPGGGLGSIYWSTPGSRTKTEGSSFALLDISRVYVGKAPSVLRGAESADPDRFVTFTTKDSTNFSFEARSEESLSAWLQSINTLLLNLAFKKVQLDPTQEDQASRSFVVVDPAAPTSAQPPAHTHFDAAPEHKYSGSAITEEDPSLYESPERLQAILAQGAVFTGYSGKGKRIIVRKIFVFYEKDEDGDQYLYWSEPGSRIPDVDNALDLSEIVSVKQGTPVLAKVDDPQRVIIVQGEQLSLELVAETAPTAKAFAEGIKVLINTKGQL